MAFTPKLIEVDFSLAQGVFAGGSNSATVSNQRVEARITKAGGVSMGGASVAIYGMTLSEMSQLSTYGMVITNTGKNTITIKAGDDASALTMVYQGTIQTAYMDGQSMPEVAFRVESFTGSYESVLPIPITTQSGSGDVAQIMGQLAAQMGLAFENNGVNVKIANPYYHGSARTQAEELAQHAGIEWVIDCGVLAIWPPGQARSGDAVLISPQTGMYGYPAFNSRGIVVKTLWQPGLKFGGTINVQSALTPACGTWVIYSLDYELDSMVPKGKWFCTIGATRPGELVIS